ncbi:cell surface glycoprotein CD200 receptor 1 [Pseudochaenichthys georgianus]|uniref:cell surface glycoprotein CD200 receptor 1 n=1 Tax=Pseudochaenichthys georgianus TaxID=52239 RepID=UPI00146D1FD1|nr:cell surface glycoprotein CD200 receptor 1 [Pseudochaenichthys georgianus]
MKDIKWIYAMLVFLLSEAQSIKSGTNQSTSVNSNSSSAAHFEKIHAAFNLGSEAILTCSNKTWKDMLFVTWNIERNSKSCRIAFNDNGQNEDSCEDGKSLQNTSSSQSYLHIPKFSKDDVGVYKCNHVYNGGIENCEIDVTITVPPRLSSWLETKDNKKVAVCKAEGGNPAANISWSHLGIGNASILEVKDPQGLFTVESRLELLEGMDTENLNCSIRHPSYLEGQKTLALKSKKGYGPWLYILTVVVIIVFLAGVLFFAQKKLWRRCKLSESSPSKSPPTEDVEEVEPYASYVQRVNSIYN